MLWHAIIVLFRLTIYKNRNKINDKISVTTVIFQLNIIFKVYLGCVSFFIVYLGKL